MHDHRRRRKMIGLVALSAAIGLLAPLPISARQTCEKRVNDVTKKYFGTLLGKAANACAKHPGGTCFNVSAPAVKAKKIKQCTAGDITMLFGTVGCVSRDAMCKRSVTTADDVANCITCSVKAEVNCLTAVAFATASVPAGCVGFPSEAFLDAEDALSAQPTAAAGDAR